MGMLSSGFSHLFLFLFGHKAMVWPPISQRAMVWPPLAKAIAKAIGFGNLAKKMFSWTEDDVFMAGFDFDFLGFYVVVSLCWAIDRMEGAKLS